MNILELIAIAIGLSMDAFAVSICKGLSLQQLKPRHAITAGIYFGGFQAIMPFLGYMLGSHFQEFIVNIDHWIAFAFLAVIGINMIRESRDKEEEVLSASFSPRSMLPLAIATSIDALAIGITFAFLKVRILPAISLIGFITFALSIIGVKVGYVFGKKYKSKAELIGGLVLIIMGFKILLEHLAII